MLIGFAGLGRMGLPMALQLVPTGHRVLAQDPRLSSVPEGIAVVASVSGLAEAELSISMLPDGAATRELVLTGLAGAGSEHLHVVMGTVGPALVKELATVGPVDVIDAPVSGSVSMAEAATITTMVGGTAEQFGRVRRLKALAAVVSGQSSDQPPTPSRARRPRNAPVPDELALAFRRGP
ncbi:NAD(P)-binding domain-containing protein [Amycolatopsis regifaucium]|uniref:6-phosphogluconate dehydrogenase NADP-binding domain-containing protein n=1 Tax=Amycolatopsis regifaucium TaxID=546365 RepID=A0A154MVT3_9PSEU|nr:NAD(P)-binding domain-containing protein [Amycolatopsis regifaucium]KZB88375.1 hypothetical protein AVL48_20755 [Amycolatopsis regifaucium]OKA11486.1 hypothetical protein ATP06_0201150 [Amycolatopsis regifaucium]SFH40483.1 NAD binding domain of 6-phosphogluconate dehydrogenase [Amycolatopsis regifaucium]